MSCGEPQGATVQEIDRRKPGCGSAINTLIP
jgi:hypothetical protein